MIARRSFLLWIGGAPLLGALPARAQERRVRRIGFFSAGSPQNNAARLAAFREGMAALRWVEGRDYVMDARYASGVAKTMEDLAAQVIAAQPDLLLTGSDEPVRQLVQRTKTIPIVFTIAQDPVGSGLAASLQRPGGNATGLTTLARDLSAKRLQLLKEAFPRVAHVVALVEPDNVGSVSQLREIEGAAPHLKIRVTPIELRKAADIEAAFKRGAALGAQAYMVAPGFLVNTERRVIADRIMRSKVPGIFGNAQQVEAGGLMSYSVNDVDNFHRAAGYVDKILKGAKPGDLPIEQPTRFELVLNLKTAKAMGITFPKSFLARADRVIE